MSTAEEFIKAAWQAAPRFGLLPESITLLSHSENVVCEVALGHGERRAMRLHRPGYNTLAQLRCEVLWVTALGQFGIPVPLAIPTADSTLDDPTHYVEVKVGNERRQVGVVDWVQGEPLGNPIEAESPDVVGHYERIGVIAAQIRTHHDRWTPPAEFERRSWNIEGLLGESPLWGRFWEVAALTDTQRALFARCRTALCTELGSLSTDADAFGLIHADLHLGNLMAEGDHLTVIDFDDAGFGWFSHELAVALHPVYEEAWEADARAALLGGYRTAHPLTKEEENLIDAFLTMRCLMLIGWLSARSELPIYQHFDDLAAQAARAAQRYLS